MHTLVPVSVRMDILREEMANRSITKNVTLPAWLNKMAMEHKINFSSTLQEALRERLGGCTRIAPDRTAETHGRP